MRTQKTLGQVMVSSGKRSRLRPLTSTLLGLSKIKKFDFISIDAEGHDLEILRQMDLKALGCQMLCIEHGGRQEEIKALCPGMKEVYNGGINLILVR